MILTPHLRYIRAAIAVMLALGLSSACSPAAPQPIPTLYVIPTWPPTALPTIAPLNDPSSSQPTAISEAAVMAASPTIEAAITLSPFPTETPTDAVPTATTTCIPDALFLADITIPGNTTVSTGQRFTKIWRMQNTGNCDWGAAYRLVFWAGEQMSASSQLELPFTPPGQPADVSLPLIAPSAPGTYLGIWKLLGPDGLPFGAILYVQVIVIQTEPTLTPTARPSAAATNTAAPTSVAAATTTKTQPPPPGPTYPSISGITSRSREIFVAGRQRGNNRYAFAKVGDSLTATYLFLYQIGDRAEVLGSYASLSPTIDYFRTVLPDGANPFNRTSRAATGGWDSVMVLDPSRADPSCAGQTPIQCELTELKPAIALILIGTNDAQHHLTSGLYELNLRRMVDASITNGTIPVLYTIPWNQYRDPVPFNAVIAKVARAYDIPLVDYYTQMEQLPNHGVSDDLVHPSEPPDHNAANFSTNLGYGTTVRNLVTLQLLDALWRTVMYD